MRQLKSVALGSYSSLFASLPLLLTLGCGDSGSDMMMTPVEKPLNERMVGTWESMTCESAASFMGVSLYVKRRYQFLTPTTWQVTADLYADQGCAFKFVTFDAKGTFTAGALASTPAGATELNFGLAERGTTAWLPMAKDALNMIKCGGYTNWAVGVRQDVSSAGCDPLTPSVASCMTEYDLAQLTNASTLVLGNRGSSTTAQCTARPTTLGAPLLKL